MNTSTPCTDLLVALLAARLAFPPIVRNCQGFSKRTSKKYGYADLSAIVDATTPVLGQHGLLLVQAIEDGEGGSLQVASTLSHVPTGQWLSFEMSVAKPEDMLEFGSASTYSNRYAQVALLNLSIEADDDAASLSGPGKGDKPAAAEKVRPTEPVNGNGHKPAPEPDQDLAHPTEGHIAALATLAMTECHEDKEVYYQRIRQTKGLKASASVAPKLLTRTMSMTQYMTLFEYHRRLEAQLAKSQQEATSGTASPETPATQPAAEPAAESLPVDPPPTASSSAPEPGPKDTVELLVAEAIAWGLKEDVTRRVITLHTDLAKCRRILADAAERNRRQVA